MTQDLIQIVEKEAVVQAEYGESYIGQYEIKAFVKGANFALTLNRWVDVNQELPEAGERVLVFQSFGTYVVAHRDLRGKWRETTTLIELMMVTHYQHLPPAP